MTEQERERAAKALAEKSRRIAASIQAEERRMTAELTRLKAKSDEHMALLKETDPAEYERIQAEVREAREARAREEASKAARLEEAERAQAAVEQRYPPLQAAADLAASALSSKQVTAAEVHGISEPTASDLPGAASGSMLSDGSYS